MVDDEKKGRVYEGEGAFRDQEVEVRCCASSSDIPNPTRKIHPSSPKYPVDYPAISSAQTTTATTNKLLRLACWHAGIGKAITPRVVQ